MAPSAPSEAIRKQYLQVLASFAGRRIGKAVQFRHVPNAVRRMDNAECHWRQPGRCVIRLNPSQKTGREIV